MGYVPGGPQKGNVIKDVTLPSAIPKGTTLKGIKFGAEGTFILSHNVTGPGVGNGDVISISPNVTALHSLNESTSFTVKTVDVLNNVMVANLSGGVVGGSAAVSSLFEISFGNYTNVNWANNYLDATGSLLFRFAQKGGIPVGASNFTGNTSLITGSTVMTGYNRTGP